MANTDDELQRMLQALSAQFLERLETELPELADHAAQLAQVSDAPRQKRILQSLQAQLHKLAGAAGTFGYAQLGEQARELELRCVTLLDSRDTAQLQAHAAAVQAFSQLERQQSAQTVTSSPQPVLTPPTNEGELSRRIYILEAELEVGKHLQTTLRNFGYAAEHYTTSTALKAAVQQQLPDVLIVDTQLDEEPSDGLNFSVELLHSLPLPLPLLTLSNAHDFDTRLRAVRAGSIGFFNKPVNFTALERRLENIFAQQRGEPYRVLIIDDDIELSSRYRLVLNSAGMQVETLNNPREIDDQMHRVSPEVILLDVHMPDCSGPELAQIIRLNDAWLRVPIIYLSAETDIAKQMNALLKAGDDFVTKPISDNALIATILARAQRARLMSNALARDSLTGLLKHADIKEQVAAEVERATRSGSPLCVVMLDLDHFKLVNDNYGHATGDNVIHSLANLLRQRLRRIDSLGRYGGEEFTIVLPDCNLEQATVILNSIRERFAELPFVANNQTFSVTFSAGIAQNTGEHKANELIDQADQALYAAKKAGRNRVVCFNPN